MIRSHPRRMSSVLASDPNDPTSPSQTSRALFHMHPGHDQGQGFDPPPLPPSPFTAFQHSEAKSQAAAKEGGSQTLSKAAYCRN